MGDYKMRGLKAFPSAPTWALLAGATTWGIVWYPYRLLEKAGVDGTWATLFTYLVALVVGVVGFPRIAAKAARPPAFAILMGLAIGWSNLAYVLGVLEGEVMRVLLLFYLAPLWTVPLARVFLDERLDARGLFVMGLAFAGAMIMLWHREMGMPWPASKAEWLGLAAGFFFALGNVLVRRLTHMGDVEKSIVIWAGVALVAAIYVPFSSLPARAAIDAAAASWVLVVGIGLALLGMSLALQYGLSRLDANRAIVILLFELVVAAIASYVFAGEVMRPQDWVGGALIVAATVFPTRYPARDASA